MMMKLKQKPKESWPELKNPGDPEHEWCCPGSIEQQLDMCESGSLRGDTILHRHGRPEPEHSGDPRELDEMINNSDPTWQMDLSEENREGDEMSGDEHSGGLEGGESELGGQPHIHTGLPGDQTLHEEHFARILDEDEQRALQEIPDLIASEEETFGAENEIKPLRRKRR